MTSWDTKMSLIKWTRVTHNQLYLISFSCAVDLNRNDSLDLCYISEFKLSEMVHFLRFRNWFLFIKNGQCLDMFVINLNYYYLNICVCYAIKLIKLHSECVRRNKKVFAFQNTKHIVMCANCKLIVSLRLSHEIDMKAIIIPSVLIGHVSFKYSLSVDTEKESSLFWKFQNTKDKVNVW